MKSGIYASTYYSWNMQLQTWLGFSTVSIKNASEYTKCNMEIALTKYLSNSSESDREEKDWARFYQYLHKMQKYIITAIFRGTKIALFSDIFL